MLKLAALPFGPLVRGAASKVVPVVEPIARGAASKVAPVIENAAMEVGPGLLRQVGGAIKNRALRTAGGALAGAGVDFGLSNPTSNQALRDMGLHGVADFGKNTKPPFAFAVAGAGAANMPGVGNRLARVGALHGPTPTGAPLLSKNWTPWLARGAGHTLNTLPGAGATAGAFGAIAGGAVTGADAARNRLRASADHYVAGVGEKHRAEMADLQTQLAAARAAGAAGAGNGPETPPDETGGSALNHIPNWAKGLGIGAGALGAGYLANRALSPSKDEEDEEGGGSRMLPTLGGLGVGLGAGALGAHYLSGGEYGKLVDPAFWKGGSWRKYAAAPPSIPGLAPAANPLHAIGSALTAPFDAMKNLHNADLPALTEQAKQVGQVARGIFAPKPPALTTPSTAGPGAGGARESSSAPAAFTGGASGAAPPPEEPGKSAPGELPTTNTAGKNPWVKTPEQLQAEVEHWRGGGGGEMGPDHLPFMSLHEQNRLGYGEKEEAAQLTGARGSTDQGGYRSTTTRRGVPRPSPEAYFADPVAAAQAEPGRGKGPGVHVAGTERGSWLSTGDNNPDGTTKSTGPQPGANMVGIAEVGFTKHLQGDPTVAMQRARENLAQQAAQYAPKDRGPQGVMEWISHIWKMLGNFGPKIGGPNGVSTGHILLGLGLGLGAMGLMSSVGGMASGQGPGIMGPLLGIGGLAGAGYLAHKAMNTADSSGGLDPATTSDYAHSMLLRQPSSAVLPPGVNGPQQPAPEAPPGTEQPVTYAELTPDQLNTEMRQLGTNQVTAPFFKDGQPDKIAIALAARNPASLAPAIGEMSPGMRMYVAKMLAEDKSRAILPAAKAQLLAMLMPPDTVRSPTPPQDIPAQLNHILSGNTADLPRPADMPEPEFKALAGAIQQQLMKLHAEDMAAVPGRLFGGAGPQNKEKIMKLQQALDSMQAARASRPQ